MNSPPIRRPLCTRLQTHWIETCGGIRPEIDHGSTHVESVGGGGNTSEGRITSDTRATRMLIDQDDAALRIRSRRECWVIVIDQ